VKILLLQHAAGDRFRTLQYFEALKREGLSFTVRQSEAADLLQEAARADLVWVARLLLSPGKLVALKKANPRWVFDFDDALWLRSSRRGATISWSKALKFRFMLKASRQVVAGNDFLAEKARSIVPARQVHVIPTTVNRDWYAPREEGERAGAFTLGWLGSRATLPYLENLRPAFEAFHSLGHAWALKIIADAFPDWPHLPVLRRPWSLEMEKKELPTFDVGLNPLPDDDWCRGKCALKVLQYFAAAVPAIASPVGVNRELVEDGVTGLRAVSQKDWFEAFKNMERELGARREMGRRAREKMWQSYTMESQAPRLLEVFKRVLA
jgi:glycosyltransferase involved in cell wall biosynthesis